MMTMIMAAALAAQPANAPASPPAHHDSMMQMDKQHREHGQMAEMKECCCKDMMAKMHEGHNAKHDGHSGQ